MLYQLSYSPKSLLPLCLALLLLRPCGTRGAPATDPLVRLEVVVVVALVTASAIARRAGLKRIMP